MKEVNRPPKPNTLTKNATKWTNKLLAEILRCSGSNEKVEDKFYNKYRQDDVKAALKEMYGSCCCYCESHIGAVDFPHIEHRKPKKQKDGIPIVPYPQLAFDWDNLHLSCIQCNIAKGNLFDTTNEILDPGIDRSIDLNFSFHLGIEGLDWMPETPRGKTTQEHTDLNRKELAIARMSIYRPIINQLEQIKKNSTNPGNDVVINELKKKAKNKATPFGWIYRELLKSYNHI